MTVFELLGAVLLGLVGVSFIIFGVIAFFISSAFSTTDRVGEITFCVLMVIIGVAIDWYTFSHITLGYVR